MKKKYRTSGSSCAKLYRNFYDIPRPGMPIWSTCSCTFRNTVEHGLEHGPIPIEILDFRPIPRDLNILLLYKTGNWNTETRTPWNFHLLPPPARSRILWGGRGVGMSLFSGCSSVATLLYQLFCGNPAEPTLQKQSCSVRAKFSSTLKYQSAGRS